MSLLKSILGVFQGAKDKDDPQLRKWKKSESRDVTRPRDRRTKYCVENIGREITIKYKGKQRTIKPLRVYTKPMFRKTYVEAMEGWRRRTFDIDDIKLVRTKKK
jgi:hypothetical protein